MKRKSLILVGLFVIFSLIVIGCGGVTPVPTEETQAPTPGFTPAQVCKVPDVVGLDQTAAEGMLTGLGLQPVKSSQYDPTVAEGAVISQEPSADTRMEPCEGDVTIVISLGPVPQPTEPPTSTPTSTPVPPTDTPVPPTMTPTPSPVPPTATPSPPVLYSHFDGSDTEGWTTNAGSIVNPAAGGSGGGLNNGCLLTSPPSDGKGSYYIAPSKYYGDWSNHSQLRLDMWSSGGSYSPSKHADIIITSGHMTAGRNLPYRPPEHWETFVIYLIYDEEWTFEGGATSLTDILYNVTDFRINAEYGNGADESGLDNVELFD